MADQDDFDWKMAVTGIVYRNELCDTTNLVVVYGGRTLYARDQLGGRRQGQADQVRQENEASFDPRGIRERLIARRAKQQTGDHDTLGG